jgi:hypothetical protein
MHIERLAAFVYGRSVERPYFVYFVSFVVKMKRRLDTSDESLSSYV